MARAPTTSRPALFGGVRIGSVSGVVLIADWSLLLIVGLITVNLGAGVFPAWHPEWSALLGWSLALVAALLLIASIAAHELSHALVGRRVGVPIRRITLFVFGGMAHMEGEPPDPRAELWMALVGPIVSLLIGVGATVLGLALAGGAAVDSAGDPAAYAAALGPGATLLLWLGPINVLLGLFNLVPGFPLDGGRVLRAILWGATGDLEKATRWAAQGGQAIGWTLMALGVAMAFGFFFPVIGGGLVQGLWFVLIGWFLAKAARASYEHVLIRDTLGDVPVSEVMRLRVESVPPDLPISQLARDHIMASDQSSFPVVSGGRLLGMVHMFDLRRAPRDKWDLLTVADIMTPAERIHTVRPDDVAVDALTQLAEHDQVPVVDEEDRLVGVTRRADLIKWVSLH